jgi:hypothetical protein
VALLAGLMAAGCGTQAQRVDCDGRLEPINHPVPKAAVSAVRDEPTEAERAVP